MCGSGVDLLGAGQWDFSDLYIIWFIFWKIFVNSVHSRNQ